MAQSHETIVLNDISKLYAQYQQKIDNRIASILRQGRFINGPEVKELKTELEKYLNVNHAIPCANGTDALQIALMALELKPGDEVITTAFSFAAAAEVCVLLGLKPILVDIDPGTFNLAYEDITQKITPKTKCIIPVHLFGLGCDMQPLIDLCRAKDIRIIEDNAQSFGGRKNGQLLGTLCDISTTSFFPTKNLGCFGDGGAVFTNDADLASKIQMITNHGTRMKYHHEIVGLNSRLDTIQAGILLEILPHLDQHIKSRQAAARYYFEELKDVEGLILPTPDSEHTFNQFTIRIPDKRDPLRSFLSLNNVSTSIYYPESLHKQKAFFEKPLHGDFSATEKAVNEVLSLPMHPFIKQNQIKRVCDLIKSQIN